jgi:macrolide transport system ATP-binding/permease protein
MRQFLRRLRYLFHHRQMESDFNEELDFHQAMTQRELEERGAGSADASLAARRALGSAALARDEMRDVWTGSWLRDAGQDVRFAARLMVKDRRFTLAAVAALALGIAANNTVFTFINAALIRDLPFEKPNS